MASFVEVLSKMNELKIDEKSTFQIINNNLMNVNRGSKKTPSSLKIAVPEETAKNFLTFNDVEQIGILVMVDRVQFFETNKLLDEGKSIELKKQAIKEGNNV